MRKIRKTCTTCGGTFEAVGNNKLIKRCGACQLLQCSNLITDMDGYLLPSNKVNFIKKLTYLEEYEDYNFNNSDDVCKYSLENNISITDLKSILKLRNEIYNHDILNYGVVGLELNINNRPVETIDPLDVILEEELTHVLEDYVTELNVKERAVVKLMFGLTDERGENTLEETANILRVNRERIRQIYASGLRNLTRPRLRRELEEYISRGEVT